MKLSVSNIAWSAEYDAEMYEFLRANNFAGLEIAPTRIFPDAPYDEPARAKDFAHNLNEEYGLEISSVQSIWYGVAESVFGSDGDRRKLVDYTKKAIDFAYAAGCRNLVFGCPKNRAVPPGMAPGEALPVACDFFCRIGDYAAGCGTCIAIEPNPPVYNTNFINTTAEAAELCRAVANPGIKINADTGALIHNGENIGILRENISLINHIHISEPRLVPIEPRELHKELKGLDYDGYLSAEMANTGNIELLKDIIKYIKGVYGI